MLERPVSVTEYSAFRRSAADLLNEDERAALVDLIAYDPTIGTLMPGTGGLRKVRFGYEGRGKRGGLRVIYYFYDEDHPVLLLALFAKNAKSDLTGQQRKEFASLVAKIVAKWKRS